MNAKYFKFKVISRKATIFERQVGLFPAVCKISEELESKHFSRFGNVKVELYQCTASLDCDSLLYTFKVDTAMEAIKVIEGK